MKLMYNHRYIAAALLSLFLFANLQAQNLNVPAPSPSTTVKQEFALSSIELSYSRPAVKGRKIFGELVPFGKVWRTGANAATTVFFGDEVTIGGKKVPAGKYGLLTIPGQSEWTIIISKQTDVTSPSAYKQSEDVVRLTAKAEELPFSIESFMIVMDNIKSNSLMMSLAWDRTIVSFPITAEIDTKIMSQIDEQMKGSKPPYFMAAYYYLENGKDLNKAVEWFDKAIAENPKAYWMFHQKARAQSQLGKKKEAIESATKSMTLAKEAQNPDYVSLNEKLIASLK